MKKFNNLILEGIRYGRQFIGPKIVQIDLTGRCNNNCIGCWVHSPYIKNPPRDKNVTLPFSKVKELIYDLAYLGTEEVILAGAGEPFLHPNILEIIELIKNKGLKLNIITNFTLINEKRAKRLIDLGVDLLTASIWAGTAKTYIKTHPKKTKEDFYKIKESLKNLSLLKARKNKYLPHIRVYNVICNQNYKEICKMIDFALDVQAEFIEFQVMDIIERETSFLALSAKHIKDIKKQFSILAKRNDLYFKDIKLFNLKASIEEELKEFPGRFIKVPRGFSLLEKIKKRKNQNYKPETSWLMTCPKDIALCPKDIAPRNPIYNEENNTLTFFYPSDKCRKNSCPDCPVDKKGQLRVKFLGMLGFGSLMRRINLANIYGAIYEKDFVENLPCYVGWIYSRVISTGEVIPCCKGINKPLGNINKDNFSSIWNSNTYQEFRYKARFLSKKEPYFKEFDCFKSCDNVGMNLHVRQSVFRDKSGQDLNYRLFPKREIIKRRTLPEGEIKILLPVLGFKSGNLNSQHNFGKGLAIDGGHGFGFGEYEVEFSKSGKYEMWVCYASDEWRPVELYFDGKLIVEDASSSKTGGWTKEFLCWFKEATFDVDAGRHNLKIFTKGLIPHIHSFAFIKGAKESQDDKDRCLSLSEDIYPRPSPLRLLKDKFKTIGFFSSSFRLANNILSGRLIDGYLDILGALNGSYAFKGPSFVQLDLTYNCNNNCIACWCNSPLLEEKTISPEIKKQTLPFNLVKELFDELSHMGTKEISFSGGGEPFIHPQIMEILAYARKKGFTCYMNTNFTLLDKERIKGVIDLGIGHLTVSTWAATPQTYAATHPNKNEDTFRQITENLIFLNRTKRRTPFIKLYNVIFNLNYHELKDMVYFAKQTGCESVEFTLIDTIPGKTERLLLSPDQIKELQENARCIAENLDSREYWNGLRLYKFDSFLRRISSSLDLIKATYDRNIVDKMPCYVGWCFSRIMPTGDVNACLKAHRIPTGNLYQTNFSEIWNGEKQRYFRKKTMVYEKKDPFFKLFGNDPDIKEAGCYKSCDDIEKNVYIHNRIMSLTTLERKLLKIAAKLKQKPKLYLDSQNKSEDPIIRGILNGRKAFVGPEQVVIDITNRCNERCIGCWLYSPLLKKRPDNQWLNREIDFSKAKSLIDELAILGTKQIRFSGGGEPFIYPKIMELIEYVKAKGLICCITTSFSLLNKEKIRDLIRLKVDELAISLWASNKETYKKTHPGVAIDTFEKIKENLIILNNEKKDKPFVTLYNVICNLNYLEVEEMFKFAMDMKTDGIYFTLVDTLGGINSLLLNGKQRQVVLKQTEAIQRIWQGLPKAKRIKLDYFAGFTSRLKQYGSLKGRYDCERVNQIPCYAGWIFARILADGSVCPCYRGFKKIMGNINGRDFKDIWFSDKYNEFRGRAKYLPKTDTYFSKIGCMKMCDNLMHNEEMHHRI